MIDKPEIHEISAVTLDIFKNDDGELPVELLFVTGTEIEPIVILILHRFRPLLEEYALTADLRIGYIMVNELDHADGSQTILGPSMLAMSMKYPGQDERLLVLELADSREHFSLH